MVGSRLLMDGWRRLLTDEEVGAVVPTAPAHPSFMGPVTFGLAASDDIDFAIAEEAALSSNNLERSWQLSDTDDLTENAHDILRSYAFPFRERIEDTLWRRSSGRVYWDLKVMCSGERGQGAVDFPRFRVDTGTRNLLPRLDGPFGWAYGVWRWIDLRSRISDDDFLIDPLAAARRVAEISWGLNSHLSRFAKAPSFASPKYRGAFHTVHIYPMRWAIASHLFMEGPSDGGDWPTESRERLAYALVTNWPRSAAEVEALGISLADHAWSEPGRLAEILSGEVSEDYIRKHCLEKTDWRRYRVTSSYKPPYNQPSE